MAYQSDDILRRGAVVTHGLPNVRAYPVNVDHGIPHLHLKLTSLPRIPQKLFSRKLPTVRLAWIHTARETCYLEVRSRTNS